MICVASDVMVEVEVDHISGETSPTLFEQECGFVSPKKEGFDRQRRTTGQPKT